VDKGAGELLPVGVGCKEREGRPGEFQVGPTCVVKRVCMLRQDKNDGWR
jgi:hypothetical protein